MAVGAPPVLTRPPVWAAAAGVSGEAYGHYTRVGLFGGPPGTVGPAPRVELPPDGSAVPLTAAEPDGATAVYGPATVFGGRWPADVGSAPRSGPVSVSTQGTPGDSVTSRASIVRFADPVPVTCDGDPPASKRCRAPGGFGPAVPAEGDELHATCTAGPTGVTGSARFVNAVLTTSTTPEGNPREREPIPEHPPPNYTRETTIDSVGGKPKLIFNEQILEADGSLTVNAVHMFLRGPIALGEQILGHVRCSTTPAPASATATSPAGVTPSSAPGGSAPASPPARSGPSPFRRLVPIGLGAALVAVMAVAVPLRRRRRRRRRRPPASAG